MWNIYHRLYICIYEKLASVGLSQVHPNYYMYNHYANTHEKCHISQHKYILNVSG